MLSSLWKKLTETPETKLHQEHPKPMSQVEKAVASNPSVKAIVEAIKDGRLTVTHQVIERTCYRWVRGDVKFTATPKGCERGHPCLNAYMSKKRDQLCAVSIELEESPDMPSFESDKDRDTWLESNFSPWVADKTYCGFTIYEQGAIFDALVGTLPEEYRNDPIKAVGGTTLDRFVSCL